MDERNQRNGSRNRRVNNLTAMLKLTNGGESEYRARRRVKKSRQLDEGATLQLWMDWNFAIALRHHRFDR
jgi:hypothetical protein